MLDAETREIDEVCHRCIDDVFKFQQPAVVQRREPHPERPAPVVCPAEEFQDLHFGPPTVRRLRHIAFCHHTVPHIQYTEIAFQLLPFFRCDRFALVVHLQFAPVRRIGQFALKRLRAIEHAMHVIGRQCAPAKPFFCAGPISHVTAGQAKMLS